ncbi:transcriptional regulator, ArsR family [Candidatus Moduliflexus flocculans]|uniref:Transcriptional regulator, ArsR family n=1 Tax=Candidatus Moduliflexus flocculans TaxID=1499966 RepID=A0A081BPM5_9BACT|nr:transcriptional regulator, ArsR family [Candidatus Moduliflexus flocculans]
MKFSESISIIKALADSSRLRILDALLEKPRYVEELAECLHLAVSTVSFHLKKLEQANLVSKVKEQYYVMFYANRNALSLTLKDLITVDDLEKSAQEERIQAYKAKVIRTFFADGKLTRIPAQQKKRWIVFEEIARRFTPGQTYQEDEVNARIADVYDDYCTLRRAFVDGGIFTRDGATYSVNSDWAAVSRFPEIEVTEDTMDRRTELKQTYKENPPMGGVFQIKNMQTGKLLIVSSTNLAGKINSSRFQLKHGSHRNKALQQDWQAYGAEAFSFDTLEELERKDRTDKEYGEDVAALEAMWLEKAQPYDERGYNTRRKA